MTEPSRQRAIDQHERGAPTYDRRTRWLDHFRRQAIARLGLGAGDTVLDVACGTGVNFPLLEERVGIEGRIVGIDLSPGMLRRAQRRVAERGYRNVILLESAVEDAELPSDADAALFSLAHDVLQSPAALENVVGHLRSRAGVASFGSKWAPRWRLPVNAYVWYVARRYVTTFEGFDRPWQQLAPFLRDLRIEEVALGGAYIAWGTWPGEA